LILHGRIVEQVVNRSDSATFRKEIVVTGGRVPLAMVRKRVVPSGSLSQADRVHPSSVGGTRAPVLLVHGFGQNRYAWHLPARSFANHLACAGFDVFNLDLRGHGRSRRLGARRCHGIEDYVREDLPAAVEEVCMLSDGRPVWIIGHSLGGLVAYASAPELAGAVAGVVSIGSPYHFTRGSMTLGALALFFRALNVAPLPNAPLPLAPVSFTMRSLWRFAESPFYPLPVRGWHAGSCEPDVLEQHLRLAFDRAALAEMVDLFDWASQRRFGGRESDYVERFEQMDLPLLVIAGANDDLAPPPSVRPAFLRSRSKDKTYRALPLGHIDLLVGRDAPKSTWSLVTDWLTKRVA
jgi:polyhydroxyalkanoate synthase